MEVIIIALAVVALVLACLAWAGYDGRLLYIAVIILAILVLLIVAGPQLGALRSFSPLALGFNA